MKRALSSKARKHELDPGVAQLAKGRECYLD
jgi:hypothetical protein